MSLEESVPWLATEDASTDNIATAGRLFRGSGGDSFVSNEFGGDRQLQNSAFSGRIFDVLFSALVLVAVAPFLLLLILALQIDNPGPIFFVQRRVGRNGALFPCLKLRTMVTDAKERLEKLLSESPEAHAEWIANHKLRNDPRVTRLGRFARQFSLDELPQLANILAGHMSVVGPRPIVEAEIWRYGHAFEDYCSVRPGLTGLWQVSGRNDTSYDERVRLDRHYARSKCLTLDLRIIARTFSVVLDARGAY